MKRLSHIQATYILTGLLIIIVIISNLKGYRVEVFSYPFLVIALGAYYLYRQRKTGWQIIYIHAIAIVTPLIFYLPMGAYGRSLRLIPAIPNWLLIPIFVVLIVFLLMKPLRQRFAVHTREIVIASIGGLFIGYVPRIAQQIGGYQFGLGYAVLAYFILLLFFLYFLRQIPPLTYSNWNAYLPDVQGLSSHQYYNQLQEKLEEQNVEGIGYSRVMLSKRGFLSSKREYLRVSFEDVTYDISFYPYALGTYASAWSYHTFTGGEYIVISIPLIGQRLHKAFYPETYYIADTRAMFRLLVHEVQLEIIDFITKKMGVRALTEQQRQVQSRGIFER